MLRDELRRLVHDRPDMDQSDLARALGVSRQRIHQLVKDEGLVVQSSFNHHTLQRKMAVQRYCEAILSVFENIAQPPATWKSLLAAAGLHHTVGAILRRLEPDFHATITARLAPGRGRALSSEE